VKGPRNFFKGQIEEDERVIIGKQLKKMVNHWLKRRYGTVIESTGENIHTRTER